ncbi:VENN motif pre-toxin domain-containing protein, partial [Lelliottia sp. V106_10]|uniref:VENN motif pre-toxin domain-containing protein n=1 Tax=Lelliottia wanjuensis TaxID=3050585 RepID=UPI00254CF977
YDAVQEQTGIFAGKGGFDITVGEHTQLNGAVISSTSAPENNLLDTGTLGFSNIDNHAEYEVEHQSAGLSSGGSIGGQFAGNMANGLLVGANGEGSADSTTKSAISDGTITIRDKDKQTQNVDDLSRDVANANPGLDVIFDKEKEQRRLQEIQAIGEIGSQAADIVRTQGQIEATKKATEKMKTVTPEEREAAKTQWQKEHPEKPVTDEDINGQLFQNAYNEAFSKSDYGTGGSIQQGIQAATAAIQGLAGGDMAKALAGGSAPYLAEMIHDMTTDPVTGKVNTEANLIAHAVVGAVVAQINGNSALAGASGAVAGEYIAQQLYPDIPRDKLTEEQKQTISALSTLAAGIIGGLVGDSTANVVAGAQAGKNAAENNNLSLLARGCAIAAPCRTKVAEQLLEIGAKAGMVGLAGAAIKDMAGKMTSDELDHLLTLEMMGNDEITEKYLSSLQDKYGSGDVSAPNMAKDLTDAEKAELGGVGSGTGTPPENDPKQQNKKSEEKLNQKQESAIKKIDNTIKNAIKDHDITGTLKDMDGNPVPKENGGYWDHMQEMQNTLRGLRNHADTLKNVNNPEAQAAYGRATDAINKIEAALKGHGI